MEQSASKDCKNLNNGEHICRLLKEIATASFFKRVFQWREILLFTGAARAEYEDLKRLLSEERRVPLPAPDSDGQAGNAMPEGKVRGDVIRLGNFLWIACRDRHCAYPEPDVGQNAFPKSDKEDSICNIEQIIAKLTCEIYHRKSLLADLKNSISQFTAQKDSLSKEMTRYSTDLERYNKEQEEIETELKSYHLSVDDQRERLYELRIKLTRHSDTIHSLCQKIADISTEIEGSESKRGEFVKRYEGLTVELDT